MKQAGVQLAEEPEQQADKIVSVRWSFGNWENAPSRGLIVVVALALTWYTWARWGDIQIDCGRELYVPTEILRGKLIYRDIFYQYGPLAPYLMALLIGVFGAHLLVFYSFGIVVAISSALLLFELGTILDGRVAGLTAALALLLVGFGPGFSNYPFPYSYSATLALLLSLLCAWFTVRGLLDRPGYNPLMAGLAASLTLLCKQEFGVACYMMLAFVLMIEMAQQRRMRPLVHGMVAYAPGVALWVAIYGWFFWALTPSYMVEANWIQMPGTYYSRLFAPYLFASMGQRFIPREAAALTMLAALCLTLWFLLAKAGRGLRNVVLTIMIAILVVNRLNPLDVMLRSSSKVITGFLVFPLGMFFIGCGFLAYAIYKIIQSADRPHMAGAAFCIFALVPAIRIIAGIKPWGYSVFCSMPLFLIFVIAISRCIKAATPELSVDRQGRLLIYLLAAELLMLALICIPEAAQRAATFQTSWGVIHLEPEEAGVARQILGFMSEQQRQGRGVAILPEAPIFYALTGTEAPSRWYTLLPGFISPAQEDDYISDLSRAAPEYILLTSRRSSEYGADYFGIDYNQKVYSWIESNYRIAGAFGRFRRDESKGTLETPLAASLYEKKGSWHGDRMQ